MKRNLHIIIFLMLSLLVMTGKTISFDGDNHAAISICIKDLNTDRLTVSENPDMALVPASIQKCLTTATAVSLLNCDFRFQTKCYATGILTDSILNGNLLIIGNGDPSIEHPKFKESSGFVYAVVDALQSHGIKRITGSVIIPDESLSDYGVIPQWAIEDAGWEYGVGLYAVNYSANTFNLDASTGKPVTEMPIENLEVLLYPSETETEIIHGINSNHYVISGKIPGNISTALPSPTRAVEKLIAEECARRGILVDNEITNTDHTSRQLIYTWYSPMAIDLMRCLMFHSDNLVAEAILRAQSPEANRNTAIERQTEYWTSRGIDCDHIRISDGSGLSRTNHFSARFLNDVLCHMAQSENADTYINLFPRIGREGTVRNFMKGTRLDGRIALKTGSMSGIQCYAGYRLDASGHPTHTIVIMINNFSCRRSEIINAVKSLLLKQFP